MFKFSTTYINLLSLIISLIIFVIIQVISSNYNFFSQKSTLKTSFNVENKIQNTEKIQKETFENLAKAENLDQDNTWYIEIPRIDLKANIKEGTSSKILDDYIGHFEETHKINGNIGLAAHNRGYKNNYFAKIKNLQEGDIIYYVYEEKTKKYEVINQNIIKDTDWYCLENTEENMLTLITCVENQPEYRRCVQAK